MSPQQRRRPPPQKRTGPRPQLYGWEDVPPTIAGVYAILNWVNGRCYVGATQKLRARMQSHRSSMAGGESNSSRLRNDLHRMGAGCFCIFPLELVPAGDPTIKETLKLLEEEWIYRLRSDEEERGYNGAIKGWWTSSARLRDSERKYIRWRSYELLPGVNLYDPIQVEMVRTWVPNFIRAERQAKHADLVPPMPASPARWP